MFNTRNQHDDETIDQYVTDLKTKAQTCEFKDLKDSLTRDRIVCGIQCDKTCSRLLREPDLMIMAIIILVKLGAEVFLGLLQVVYDHILPQHLACHKCSCEILYTQILQLAFLSQSGISLLGVCKDS